MHSHDTLLGAVLLGLGCVFADSVTVFNTVFGFCGAAQQRVLVVGHRVKVVAEAQAELLRAGASLGTIG